MQERQAEQTHLEPRRRHPWLTGWRWFNIAVWALAIAFSLGCYALIWFLVSTA